MKTDKQIADSLYKLAEQFRNEPRSDLVAIVYNEDGLIIRSKLSYLAISQVADKFDRGSKRFNSKALPPKLSRQRVTVSKFSKRVYDTFIEDGETENAEQYKALYTA